jgi:hypothetical protein
MRGVVAVAEAGLQDADVAAVAVLVARAQHREELADLLHVADLADRLAARMQVAALAERHQLLDEGRSSLAFGRVVTICSCLISWRHVGEHGRAVGGVRPSLRWALP